ncbi:MAG: MGMT family protein [Ardenticatenaceae bacterium]|nr:MGMT family protein [Ardenticatenaceae bacterium]
MNFYDQVYAVVRCIPSGKVTSYGRIARMLGRPRAARAVGYALNALKDHHQDPNFEPVPWHRVINAAGRISTVNRELTANRQADLLRDEGVSVNEDLTLHLERYLWAGLSLMEIENILREIRD